jgi:hypothetical protein
MKLYKYSEDQLKEAVKQSTSKRQVLLKLKVSPFGGNYDVLNKAIQFFSLDISHFYGQAWNKGKKLPPRTPLEAYLKNKVPIQSFKLKNRLLRSGFFMHRCAHCKKKTWLGRPIPLELDHINGNNKDNRVQNLRLLCPNCHTFTPTFRNRKRKQA